MAREAVRALQRAGHGRELFGPAARFRGGARRQGDGARPARGDRLRLRVPAGRHEPLADARRSKPCSSRPATSTSSSPAPSCARSRCSAARSTSSSRRTCRSSSWPRCAAASRRMSASSLTHVPRLHRAGRCGAAVRAAAAGHAGGAAEDLGAGARGAAAGAGVHGSAARHEQPDPAVRPGRRSTAAQLEMQVLAAWPQLEAGGRSPAGAIEIPVRLRRRARPRPGRCRGALPASTPAEVVRRHSAGDYVVYLLGFLPGFAFMGGLPPELATPRRAEPRARGAGRARSASAASRPASTRWSRRAAGS